VLSCDNEAGKGDHRHIGAKERPYGLIEFPYTAVHVDFMVKTAA
jgi:hypothetical protein